MKIKMLLKKILRRLFRAVGVEIIRKRPLSRVVFDKIADQHISHQFEKTTKSLESSMSQLGQDMFAIITKGDESPGYFVEIGAGDGVSLSNTLMLEKLLNWTGLLVEPNPVHRNSLKKNRRVPVDTHLVWSKSGEQLDLRIDGYFSTIEAFVASDWHAERRQRSTQRASVKTISLIDLLDKYTAPRLIDFLSIDTEGSELEILSAFPWNSKYTIKSLCVEHNYTCNREGLFRLLTQNGYRRIGQSISKHDDWYVLSGDGGSGSGILPA